MPNYLYETGKQRHANKHAVVQFNHEMGDEHIKSMIEQWNRMKSGLARHKNPPPELAQLDAHIEEALKKSEMQRSFRWRMIRAMRINLLDSIWFSTTKS